MLRPSRRSSTATLMSSRAHRRVNHRRDPGPDHLDDAGALVPGAEGQRPHVAAVQEVDVAVAQPTGDVAHEHLVGLRVVDLDVDHLVAARVLEQQRGA